MVYRFITTVSLLFLLLIAAGCKSHTKQEEQMKINCIKLPGLPGIEGHTPLGVSAPFTGFSNGMLLVGGGCNFPDKPVAEGGTKRYYSEIFVLDTTEVSLSGWKHVGELPVPLAYGASVTTPQGIICIGGNNSEQSFSSVYLLTWNASEEKIEIALLPELPAPMDNLSAAYADGFIYVAGGNEAGQACNTFLSLDLQQGSGTSWSRQPDFPGPARVQPILAAQKTRTGTGIFLTGGFQPISGNQKAIIPTDLLVYHPEIKEWKTENQLPVIGPDEPRTFTGGCAVAFGDSSVLFMGGVNYNRFDAALNRPIYIQAAKADNQNALANSLQEEGKQYLLQPVEWYRFNTTLLQYNTFTGEFHSLGDFEPLARAGAGAVIDGNRLFIANGELKPGIRTPEVNLLIIDK